VNIIKFIEIFPDEKSFKDYYAFGYLMPGRESYITDYRYGFNGMEKDDEIGGFSGGHLDFGARIYDSRVGRFLSTDPLKHISSDESPFIFGGCNPIFFIDKDGNTKVTYIVYVIKDGSEKNGCKGRQRLC